ncbi:MAG: hypothetical protein J2P25_02970 [Nocardiopsaceae bacterium]|nr:hypothetical protein [Nocardiopsaceae bacterium]
MATVLAITLETPGWWSFAAFADLCWLIVVPIYVCYAIAYTRFGPEGFCARGRAGGKHCYRWGQIANLAWVATRGARQTKHAILVTTIDGDRFSLGAPRATDAVGYREFADDFARLYGAWQAAAGRPAPRSAFPEPATPATATGHPGPELETSSKRVWLTALLMAGLIIEVFVVAVFIVALVQTSAPAGAIAAFVVLVLLVFAAELSVPAYRHHRRRARARAGMAQYGGPLGF